MSMFILFITDYNLFMGCYSTLDKAKEGYEKFALKLKGEKIPDFRINQVAVDALADCFLGGYTTEAEWTIVAGGEWIKN